jgi:hypothetical protein
MTNDPSRDLYLNLMKRVLTGMIAQDEPAQPIRIGAFRTPVFVPKYREWGMDVPSRAHSMT